MTEFNYNSVIQNASGRKVTLNMGVTVKRSLTELLDNAAADTTAISGPRSLITKSTQICCRLQNPSGAIRRHSQSNSAWRTHVGSSFERLITIAVPHP